MIWIAALMMAAQTAAGTGASQSSPAVTAQQKQELSNYNFKAAAAALNAQANQRFPNRIRRLQSRLSKYLRLPAKGRPRSPLRVE